MYPDLCCNAAAAWTDQKSALLFVENLPTHKARTAKENDWEDCFDEPQSYPNHQDASTYSNTSFLNHRLTFVGHRFPFW